MSLIKNNIYACQGYGQCKNHLFSTILQRKVYGRISVPHKDSMLTVISDKYFKLNKSMKE
jgi:hypothetical protein